MSVTHNEEIVISIVVDGRDALDKLQDQMNDIAESIECISQIIGRVLTLCDYCGEATVIGLPCHGCGRVNTDRDGA